MSTELEVVDSGAKLRFSFADLMRYHGPSFPGGVAHAFKVLERGLPELDEGRPVERREVSVRTAFAGPGARDAFEMVLRAVTGHRYVVDPALERPERGTTLERYVFCLTYRARTVTLTVREGYVTEEFIRLARKDGRTATEEDRLTVLKAEMAERLLSRPAAEVYDAECWGLPGKREPGWDLPAS